VGGFASVGKGHVRVKTLSALAAAEKIKDAVEIVWLLEIDADNPDAAPVTLYYGSRAYTLSSKAYADAFLPNGLRLTWDRIRPGGGLASVARVQAGLSNEESASDVADTYFLENDEVRLYLGFVTGAEVKSDAVQISKGFIEDSKHDAKSWLLTTADGSDKDFSGFPRELVNLTDHPDAPFDAYGKPIPVAFGEFQVSPFDDADSRTRSLAPMVCLDSNLLRFTSGRRNRVSGFLSSNFQYYEGSKNFGSFSTFSDDGDGGIFVDTAERHIQISPVLPASTNDVADFKNVFGWNLSTGVEVGAGENLDVDIGGSAKLGTLTTANILIRATGTGNYTRTVKYNGVTIEGPTGSLNGNTSIDLNTLSPTAIVTHAEDWDFELYVVEIDGAADVQIQAIQLWVNFTSNISHIGQGLEVYEIALGWRDLAAHYVDGAYLVDGDTHLRNPAHVLAAVFRGRGLLELETAEVDSAAVDTAATARTAWEFRFSLTKTVDEIQWLNNYCFQAGLHLFKSYEGKWKMVAMDPTLVPVSSIIGRHQIAVVNPEAPPAEWEPDVTFAKTPTRNIINQVVLQYNRDYASDEYTGLAVASGFHRVTGTCSLVASTTKLTDGSATFVTDAVAVGDIVYISGDKEYSVDAIDSETVLDVSPVSGAANDIAAGTTYWCGANLSGAMKRSQLRYKTTNPLGGKTDASNIGGFKSEFIGDAATAALFLDHIAAWRAERRYTVEFATFLNAIDLELGDAIWFDHESLPVYKRPVQLATLTNSETDVSTDFEAADTQLIRAGDYLLVGSEDAAAREIVKVSSVDYGASSFVVTRGECGTAAKAWDSGAPLKRLNANQWEVTGLRVDVEKAQIRVEIQEMPSNGYLPLAVVGVDATVFGSASPSTQVASGWASTLSGRVADTNAYSALSFIGPDTGTY
jgi:hypothetical protein